MQPKKWIQSTKLVTAYAAFVGLVIVALAGFVAALVPETLAVKVTGIALAIEVLFGAIAAGWVKVLRVRQGADPNSPEAPIAKPSRGGYARLGPLLIVAIAGVLALAVSCQGTVKPVDIAAPAKVTVDLACGPMLDQWCGEDSIGEGSKTCEVIAQICATAEPVMYVAVAIAEQYSKSGLPSGLSYTELAAFCSVSPISGCEEIEFGGVVRVSLKGPYMTGCL